MKTLFHAIIVLVHALAAWGGLATFYVYYKDLAIWPFRIWHTLALIFVIIVVYLTYFKFFGNFSSITVATTSVVIFIVADFIAFRLTQEKTDLNIFDFIFSYVLAFIMILVVSSIYQRVSNGS